MVREIVCDCEVLQFLCRVVICSIFEGFSQHVDCSDLWTFSLGPWFLDRIFHDIRPCSGLWRSALWHSWRSSFGSGIFFGTRLWWFSVAVNRNLSFASCSFDNLFERYQKWVRSWLCLSGTSVFRCAWTVLFGVFVHGIGLLSGVTKLCKEFLKSVE